MPRLEGSAAGGACGDGAQLGWPAGGGGVAVGKMPEFSCSHYYTYDEITDLLEGWVAEDGDVCELSSIGTSLEGRELWLLTGAWAAALCLSLSLARVLSASRTA